MSQAPSAAFAALREDDLAGVPAHLAGKSPQDSSVPLREVGDERSAVAEAERHKDHVSTLEQVSLRGTTRGLEILISGTPSTAALGARLTELLAEAPGFFAGSDARVAIDGVLPSGALACLEEIATRFAVQIVEIAPVVARRRRPEIPPVLRPDDVPQVHLAQGTGPIAEEPAEPAELRGGEPGPESAAVPALPDDAAPLEIGFARTAPISVAQLDELAGAEAALAAAAPPGPRLVIGPVRSGVIVDHTGHVIVIGDVNPGAEVRAEGSIIVLGRLRGVAHAAIGRDAGFIVALSLQPQQLRIGRMVARAADADRPSDGAEIAYATGETIVVERFLGRLPSGLAASM